LLDASPEVGVDNFLCPLLEFLATPARLPCIGNGPFVSHGLTLDEVNRGFELMEAQDGIRSVIEFA
jgi:hypothetical protein